jgi:hypothetical protein
MSDLPDPLDELLRPDLPVVAAPVWRESLLARTTRTLRWRRRGRRLAILAALAACYVAGLVSMRLLRAEPAVEVRKEIVYVTEEKKPESPPERVTPPVPERPLTALALEWQAAEDPDRGAELNRRAGDRYFAEENDLASAVRCYKRFLSACPETELEVAPQDNWLLVTLKNARLEEKRHAKNNG